MKDVESIAIEKNPSKIDYIKGVETQYDLDLTGLELNVNYTDGTSEKIINNGENTYQYRKMIAELDKSNVDDYYDYYGSEFVSGTNIVELSYGNCSASFNVNASRISDVCKNSITENSNTHIDIPGNSYGIYCFTAAEEGYYDFIADFVSYDYQDMRLFSSNGIRISYEEPKQTDHDNKTTVIYNEFIKKDETVYVAINNKKSDERNVDIKVCKSKDIESFEVLSKPNKQNYIPNYEYIDYAGLSLKVTYTDGTYDIWNYGGENSINGYPLEFSWQTNISNFGENSFTVYYRNKTLDVIVNGIDFSNCEDSLVYGTNDITINKSAYKVFKYIPTEDDVYSFAYDNAFYEIDYMVLDRYGNKVDAFSNISNGTCNELSAGNTYYLFLYNLSNEDKSTKLVVDTYVYVKDIIMSKQPYDMKYINDFNKPSLEGMELTIKYSDDTEDVWKYNRDDCYFNEDRINIEQYTSLDDNFKEQITTSVTYREVSKDNICVQQSVEASELAKDGQKIEELDKIVFGTIDETTSIEWYNFTPSVTQDYDIFTSAMKDAYIILLDDNNKTICKSINSYSADDRINIISKQLEKDKKYRIGVTFNKDLYESYYESFSLNIRKSNTVVRLENLKIANNCTFAVEGIENIGIGSCGLSFDIVYDDNTTTTWKYDENGWYFKDKKIEVDLSNVKAGSNAINITYGGKSITANLNFASIADIATEINLNNNVTEDYSNGIKYYKIKTGSYSNYRWEQYIDTGIYVHYNYGNGVSNGEDYSLFDKYTINKEQKTATRVTGTELDKMKLSPNTEYYFAVLKSSGVYSTEYNFRIEEISTAKSVEIIEQPNVTEYPFDSVLCNLDGLKLKVTFENGSTYIWTAGKDSYNLKGNVISVSTNYLEKSDNEIKVYCGNIYDALTLKCVNVVNPGHFYNNKEIDEIIVDSMSKDYYLECEYFDISDFSFKVKYKDGSSEICSATRLPDSTYEILLSNGMKGTIASDRFDGKVGFCNSWYDYDYELPLFNIEGVYVYEYIPMSHVNSQDSIIISCGTSKCSIDEHAIFSFKPSETGRYTFSIDDKDAQNICVLSQYEDSFDSYINVKKNTITTTLTAGKEYKYYVQGVSNKDVTVSLTKVDNARVRINTKVLDGIKILLGDKLSDYILPDGYSWEEPEITITELVSNVFHAIYTPKDSNKYIEEFATVNVEGFRKELITSNIKLSNNNYTYSGNNLMPDVTVSDGTKTLVKGEDYNVIFLDDNQNEITESKNVGNYHVKVTGINGYYGEGILDYCIQKASQSISLSKTSYTKTFGDAAFDLGAKLVTGNGTLSYTSSNSNVATVSSTGKVTIKGAGKATITVKASVSNNYSETVSNNISITVNKAAQSISAKNVTKSSLASAFSIGAKLTKGNGSLSYSSDNTKVVKVSSKGLVTIVGKGTAYITITANETTNYKKTSTKVKVVINSSSQTIKATSSYTKYYGNSKFSLGAKITTGNGKLTYKSKNTSIVSVDSKGKVTIKGCGKTTITITAGATSKCSAKTKTVTITVKPKKATLSTLSSKSKGKIYAKWVKDSKATGYQIQYSTSSSFTKSTTKYITITKNSTISKTFSASAGKKYYVRIRSYKTSGKDKLYGSWSASKKVTVKKK